MSSNLEQIVVLARPEESLQSVITRMGRSAGHIFSIALVVDVEMVLQGVINNGDVLRLLADGVSLNR